MNPRWRRYLRFWGAHVGGDVDDELGFHVEMRIRDFIARGLTESEARRAATARLGNLTAVRNACLTIGHRRQRRMHRAQSIDAFVQDLRYAARTLAKHKTWTAVALITLALGIGASTAMFSVVNSLILNPLPYPGGDRVASIYRANQTSGMMLTPRPSMIDLWQKNARSFEAFQPYSTREMVLTGAGDATPLNATSIRADFPAFTGQKLIVGRTFLPEEMSGSVATSVILAEGVWRQRFGGDRSVVGRVIRLDDKPFTVVGVAPSTMRLPALTGRRADLWLPLVRDTLGFGRSVAVRVKPGISFKQAGAELDSILARAGIDMHMGGQMYNATLVRPEEFVGFAKSIYLLSAAVALLLIVACANVAHLMLARGATRARELAIRTALGAGRRRLMRQLLTESLLLAAVGGVLGVFVAIGGVKLLLLLRPESLGALASTRLDGAALWAALGLAALTGMAFGLTAAIDAVRRTTSDSLRNTALAGTATRHSNRLRSALVVTEMALSAMLLVGAALLVRTVVRLHGIDPGFDTAGLYTMNVDLPESRYPNGAAKHAFIAQLKDGVRKLPGVIDVADATSTPPDIGMMMSSLIVEGMPEGAAGRGPLGQNIISPNYFSTIGLKMYEGTTFGATAGKQEEVIINRGFARKLWPGQSALGKRMRFASNRPGTENWMTVIGVVGDVPRFNLKGDRTAALLYFPAQAAGDWPEATLAVRAKPGIDLAPRIRDVVRSLDSRLAPPKVQTIEAALEETIGTEAFTMKLLATFAVLAVLLSAVGLYGVISYVVTQRTREIGIRVALGATPRHVAASIVFRGVLLSALGLGIGLTAAVWGTRVIKSTLYGVTTTDPVAYAATGGVLLVVSMLACLLPMSRALAVDPVIAMRGE